VRFLAVSAPDTFCCLSVQV